MRLHLESVIAPVYRVVLDYRLEQLTPMQGRMTRGEIFYCFDLFHNFSVRLVDRS